MSTVRIDVRCIECHTLFVITQSSDHTEYQPAGKCPKCGVFHYATLTEKNGLQINAAHLIEGKKNDR
jgi:phage FluMu protein Com